MNYSCYDSSGVSTESGILVPGSEPNVPTHGSIVLNANGLLITFNTSEWLVVSVESTTITSDRRIGFK